MPRLVYLNPANLKQQYVTTSMSDPGIPAGYILTGGSDGAPDCPLQTIMAGVNSGGFPTYAGAPDSASTRDPNGLLNWYKGLFVPATVAKFYLHDATSPDLGNLPGGTSLAGTPDVTAAGASTNRAMDGNIGSAQVSAPLSTIASGSGQTGWFRRFISSPLAAQTIASGNWAIHLAGSESDANSNFTLGIYLAVWRPSTGAIVATLFGGFVTQVGTEVGITETVESGPLFEASGRAISGGDVLVVEIWRTFVAQGAATSYTNTLYYGGSVEDSTSSNAGYLGPPAPLTLASP